MVTRERYEYIPNILCAHVDVYKATNDPLPLHIHTTGLFSLPYEPSVSVCIHLRSRESYRSPSPITCEFVCRSYLCRPNSIYLVRMLALKTRKKIKKGGKSKSPISYRPTSRLKKFDGYISIAEIYSSDFLESFIDSEKRLHLLILIFESTILFIVWHIFQTY